MKVMLQRYFFFMFLLLAIASVSFAQTPLIDRTYQFTFKTSATGGVAHHLVILLPLTEDVAVAETNENVRYANRVLYLVAPPALPAGSAWSAQFILRGTPAALNAVERAPVPFDWRDDFYSGEGSVDLGRIVIGERPAGVLGRIGNVIRELRANPEVVARVKTVAVPVSVTLGAVGVGVLTTTAASSSAPFAFNMLQLFRFLALGFLRFKRSKPWGRVYSELTGNPVPGATVRIYDTQFKKLKETQMTDRDGRFGFLVTPGNYFLHIEKKGFAGLESDELHIKDPAEVLALEIPLASATNDVSEKSLRLLRALNTFKSFVDLVNPYLFVFGTALSMFVVVIVPTWFNGAILGLYIALDAVKIALARWSLKSFGTVVDAKIKTPLPLTVVRVFDERRSWLLGTRVTDALGRFNFLLLPGSYYVSCAKFGYKTYQSKPVVLKKSGIIAFDVQMERLR
ncbi:MAG: carboxypeptidase regulatory-like domain-containing protein [Candidatus Harrisonbacteria bacterium]|nr:carboxypeptidase regulatory-like domain-containing protein [Candidatus Harrisonbacteria bacterium]